jgi:hypothetical protein
MLHDPNLHSFIVDDPERSRSCGICGISQDQIEHARGSGTTMICLGWPGLSSLQVPLSAIFTSTHCRPNHTMNLFQPHCARIGVAYVLCSGSSILCAVLRHVNVAFHPHQASASNSTEQTQPQVSLLLQPNTNLQSQIRKDKHGDHRAKFPSSWLRPARHPP